LFDGSIDCKLQPLQEESLVRIPSVKVLPVALLRLYLMMKLVYDMQIKC
jgi:hypothetical protein